MLQRANPSKCYTVEQAARLFGVLAPTIRRWLKDKYLKGEKHPYGQGKRIRWVIEGREINRVVRELGS